MQAILSGIVIGCVYALIALSLVIIYKSTDVVNFAAGEFVMVAAYAGLLLLDHYKINYAVMTVLAVGLAFVLGGLFERVALSRIIGFKYATEAALVPMVVATIGLSFMLKGAVRVIPSTQEVLRLPPIFSGPPVFFGDLVLQRQDIGIVGVAVLVMILLSLGFNLTATGKALRATSQNSRAAALIGIPVKGMRTMAWAVAAGLAGISGILLAPKLLMTPDMGSVFMMGIAASIVGGFTSLVGCVIGGILLGVLQNLVGIFVSPQAITVTPFFIIMLVLVVRPNGLFGEAMRLKKV
ncbi:MAG TPA: branched-chain amino acid ABC transporter permease [Bordetella sp.]